MNICKILGIDVNVTNIKGTLEFIEDNLQSFKGDYICVSNVHTTVMAHDNSEYKKIQNSAAMVLPDGAPLSIISRLKGFKEAERVTGPDLMEEVFKLSENKGYTHYFYGSTEETLELLKQNLITKYPNLKISGMYSPPFRSLTYQEDNEIINNINNSQSDFVWVGLGAPKQEIWMYNHKGKINALMLGVGAGFDYHANTIKRAPIWMQKYSLEWCYRLFQEPKRLFKRYLNTNLKFIIYSIKELLG